MRVEVTSAVEFLSNFINSRCPDPVQVNQFSDYLEKILTSHYENHWHPGKPNKGSGYRCIRIVEAHMDPLVNRAGEKCGLSTEQLTQYLPKEITMWVDPDDVSYRIGEEGSIGMLYTGDNNSDGYSEDSGSSDDSDVCSTGSLSPESSPSSPTQEILHSSCRTASVSQYSNYNYSPARSNHISNFGHFMPQMQFVAS